MKQEQLSRQMSAWTDYDQIELLETLILAHGAIPNLRKYTTW